MEDLVGVLSILQGEMLDEARRLWKLFETEYASKGVQSFDFPNVTFQGGQCRDVSRLRQEFAALARQVPPFEVIIDGLGHFGPNSKVVFLKVQLTDELRRVHQAFTEMLGQYCETLHQSYQLGNWIPHVTVAMKDLTDQEFNRALHDLRDYHPYYRQPIFNINLVQSFEQRRRIEILESVRLTQENSKSKQAPPNH